MTNSSAPPQGPAGTPPEPAAPVSGAEPDDLSIAVVRTPHLGRLVAAAVVLVVAAAVIWSMAGNPRFRWDVVGQWLFARTIMDGLLLTLWLTAVSMAAGIAIGIVLAVMRGSRNPILSRVAAAYIWFFRGTPLLVQLLFWFNMSAVYPRIVIGLPFGGPEFASLNANAIITPAVAAFLGLSLHEGAYMAEIVRAGILSVPRGQAQAATALGMSGLQTMRRIVLPQAMRVIIPPTANQTISMLKTTSLVSVLALPDLLYSAQIVYSKTFQTIPLLIVATILYLITVSILTLAQSWIERRLRPS
jgi:polar amino acid transport system permease protein